MALRSGMKNLVQRVRSLCDAGLNEYTAGLKSYWSDDDIQDVLDSNAALLIDSPLQWQPQTIGGGTVQYLIAQGQYRDLEEATSGTARWAIRTSAGAAVGTANYSTDYRAGRVTFTADQAGTAYYLTAYTYDVHQAAADVWRQRLAHFADWYNFASNSQSFSREQAFGHAQAMLKEMERKAGSQFVANAGGDVRTSQFVRTDVNVCFGEW